MHNSHSIYFELKQLNTTLCQGEADKPEPSKIAALMLACFFSNESCVLLFQLKHLFQALTNCWNLFIKFLLFRYSEHQFVVIFVLFLCILESKMKFLVFVHVKLFCRDLSFEYYDFCLKKFLLYVKLKYFSCQKTYLEIIYILLHSYTNEFNRYL